MNQLKMATIMLAALALAAPAGAAPLPRYGMFMFSSLCANPEGGDIEGARLVIVRTPHLDEIIFDYSNGGLFGTEVTTRSIQGDKLTAKLASDEGGTAALDATLSAERVDARLHFDGSPITQDYRLQRVANFGKSMPDCRRR